METSERIEPERHPSEVGTYWIARPWHHGGVTFPVRIVGVAPSPRVAYYRCECPDSGRIIHLRYSELLRPANDIEILAAFAPGSAASSRGAQ